MRTSHLQVPLALLGIVALTACSAQSTGVDPTNDGDVSSVDTSGELPDTIGPTEDSPEPAELPPPPPSDEELRAAFFSLQNTHLVEIQLSEYSVDKLWEDPYSYVSGDVTIDGQPLPGSGVRLKGVYGSFRDLDGKSAFLLQFGKFDKDQSFLGMNKLALNNMVQDPSHIHEHLAYQLFRAGDVPGSRITYTWVQVNGADYGLYAAVEVVDNGHFLKAWFPDKKGNLYEGEYGIDLFRWGVEEFDQDAGSDESRQDLVALVDALDALEESSEEDADLDTLAALNAHIDMKRFLAFSATELYLGHWDGYSWSRNNYFIYRAAGGGRWTWIPWGLDQVFWDHLPPFDGEGRVHQLCMRSVPCREAFADELQAVLERVGELDLLEQTWMVQDHIGGAVLGDPRMEGDPDEWAWAADETRNFIVERPQSLADQLICLYPEQLDEDGDGYSGCDEDCDDGDPQVHPGAPERCNIKDDNCNGDLDEGGQCPGCAPWVAPDGTSYSLCFVPLTWEEAWLDCQEQGGDLASVHSEETQEWLTDAVYGLDSQSGNWWIGLNDREEEDLWIWTDGTPFDFDAWGYGEPNNAGAEDCAHFAHWQGGLWNDMYCEEEAGYICQFP